MLTTEQDDYNFRVYYRSYVVALTLLIAVIVHKLLATRPVQSVAQPTEPGDATGR